MVFSTNKTDRPDITEILLKVALNTIKPNQTNLLQITHSLQDVIYIFSSENQQFLKEIVTNVIEGQGVSWLKLSRIRRLMEDENYRNFVVSRINKNLDKKLNDDTPHIEDVVIIIFVYESWSIVFIL